MHHTCIRRVDPSHVTHRLKTCLLENNWPVVRDLVDDIFLLSEKQIIDAAELVCVVECVRGG